MNIVCAYASGYNFERYQWILNMTATIERFLCVI